MCARRCTRAGPGILALVAGFSATAAAGTPVSGYHWGTWDASGSPYIISGSVTVPRTEQFRDLDGDGVWDPNEPLVDDIDQNGVWTPSFPPLVIAPGVEVIAPYGDDLIIEGDLDATGVTFTFDGHYSNHALVEILADGVVTLSGCTLDGPEFAAHGSCSISNPIGTSYVTVKGYDGGHVDLEGCDIAGGSTTYYDGSSGSVIGLTGDSNLTVQSDSVTLGVDLQGDYVTIDAVANSVVSGLVANTLTLGADVTVENAQIGHHARLFSSGTLLNCCIDGYLTVYEEAIAPHVTGCEMPTVYLYTAGAVFQGCTFTAPSMPLIVGEPDFDLAALFAHNTFVSPDFTVWIGGELDGTRTFAAFDTIYEYGINGTLTVNHGAVLTVASGVAVIASNGEDLIVRGSMDATGVTFTFDGHYSNHALVEILADGVVTLSGCTLDGPEFAAHGSCSISNPIGTSYVTVKGYDGGHVDLEGCDIAGGSTTYYDGSSGSVIGLTGDSNLTVQSDSVTLGVDLQGDYVTIDAVANSVVSGLVANTLTLGADVTVENAQIGHHARLFSSGTLLNCCIDGYLTVYEEAIAPHVTGCEMPTVYLYTAGAVFQGCTFTAPSMPLIVGEPDFDLAALFAHNTFVSPDFTVWIGGELDGTRTFTAFDTIYEYGINGTLTVNHGAVLTVASGVAVIASNGEDLIVRGSMDATGVTFSGQVQLEVSAGAVVTLSGCALDGPNLYVHGVADISDSDGTFRVYGYDAATVHLLNCQFNAGRYYAGSGGTMQCASPSQTIIDAGSSVLVTQNDLSAGVWLTGSGTLMELAHNWWGTTDPAVIETKIYHCNDDPSRPCAEYTPFLETSPLVQCRERTSPASAIAIGINDVNLMGLTGQDVTIGVIEHGPAWTGHLALVGQNITGGTPTTDGSNEVKHASIVVGILNGAATLNSCVYRGVADNSVIILSTTEDTYAEDAESLALQGSDLMRLSQNRDTC